MSEREFHVITGVVSRMKDGWGICRRWTIRDPDTHRLICRYNPARRLLEHKKSERRTIVDLRQYEGGEANGKRRT